MLHRVEATELVCAAPEENTFCHYTVTGMLTFWPCLGNDDLSQEKKISFWASVPVWASSACRQSPRPSKQNALSVDVTHGDRHVTCLRERTNARIFEVARTCNSSSTFLKTLWTLMQTISAFPHLRRVWVAHRSRGLCIEDTWEKKASDKLASEYDHTIIEHARED